jgi:hypothetical protein
MGVLLMTTSRTKKLPRTLASNVLQDVSGLCGEELPRELVDECARGFVEVGRMANMEGWLMTEEAKQLAEAFFTALKQVDADLLTSEDPQNPGKPYSHIGCFTWNTLPEHTKKAFVSACEEVRSVLGM